MMERVIDTYVKNFLTYYHRDWYWVINPISHEWVVCVGESGYTFFNYEFWSDFSKFVSSDDIMKYIRNWVVYKLGVPSSDHCYPDYINGDYDWRDEFDDSIIYDVIQKGLLISF